MEQGFGWQETYQQLAELGQGRELAPDDRGRGFVALGADGGVIAEFQPPPLLPVLGRSAEDYLAAADRPGRHVLLLLQAGRTALGAFDDDELLSHKVITKYVVRGKGRAQPTHLASKGKSRYGSRLRLQNARQQLVETNEKLIEYWQQHGAPRLIHHSVPVRTWPELFAVEPAPPFDRRDPGLHKVPIHVHPPSFEELKRVWRHLSRGRIVWRTG